MFNLVERKETARLLKVNVIGQSLLVRNALSLGQIFIFSERCCSLIIIMIIIIIIITSLKSFRKYMNNILGKHEIKKAQEAPTLGTLHVLRKVPTQKHKTFNAEINITCTIKLQQSCNIMCHRHMVCFLYVFLNNLGKGDNK